MFGLKDLIFVGLLAGAVGTAAYYVREYDRRGTEIAVLQREKAVLENEVKIAKQNHEIATNTIKDLGDRLVSRLGELKDSCDMLEGIEKDAAENAKPENKDKQVDVFGNLLERLKGKSTR